MSKFTKTIFSVLCAITLLSLPIVVAHAEETQAQEDSQDDWLVDPTSGYAVQSQDIDNGDVNNADNSNENDATSEDNNVDNSNTIDNTNNVGNGQSVVVEVSSDTSNAVTSPDTVTAPPDNTATAPTSAPSSNSESAPSSNAAPATSSSSDSGGSTVSAEQAQFSNSATMPGHALYRVKLWWESAQEKFTSDNVKLLTLKQEHLQNRINELKYDANYNNNRNTDNLLQKIQISRIEVDDTLQKIKTNYQGGYIVQKVKGTQVLTKTEDYIAKAQRTNDKILTNILNDPTLSKNARKNVKDAVIKIGLMKKVKANLVQGKSGVSKSATTTLPSVAASKKTTTQGTAGKTAPTGKKIKIYRMKASMVQGSFDANPKTLSLMPFKSAMVYEPSEQKWYSIVVFSDRITISAATLDHPDVYVYPSAKQMDKLSKIIAGINRRGSITSKDKIELTLLWYQIGKREVR